MSLTTKQTEALYWAAALLLLCAAVVAIYRSRRTTAVADTTIPDRWASLRQLHPDVQQRFLQLFRRIEAKTGGKVIYGPNSGYRPGLKAGELPAYHYFGLAHDINVVLPNGTQLMMGTPVATWEASGVPAIIRAAGFRWGGQFHAAAAGAISGDPVHVDLGLDFPIAALRAQATSQAAPGSLIGFDARELRLVA